MNPLPSARRGDCLHNELLPTAFDCDGLGGRHEALRKVFARRGAEGIKNFLAEGLPESPVKQSKRRLLFAYFFSAEGEKVGALAA